jgi:DNA-binding winged helix-turn-helix (wHTH) protein/tetratricopeptide (TPR) repeat protein/TolB-like protein
VKLRFGDFVLDQETGRLLGPAGEVRLRPQAFRMLEVLVEQAPKILSQEELLDRVWGVEHLSPASVKQAVSEVRQALGDDPARPSLIETVHRRGYRFIAPVERIEDERVAAPPTPPVIAVHAPPPVEAPLIPPPTPPAPLRPSRLHLAAILVVLILTGLSALALVHRPVPQTRTPEAPAPVASDVRTSVRPAVAILGFKNLSGDAGDNWISSALTEIVGFELAAPGRVRLIPAENVARMQRELALPYAESHSPTSLAGIGRNLGTDLVVAGSYLLGAAGGTGGTEKLRIQLVVQDVRTGETVAWARETGPPEELIDLATAAARGVQGTLGVGPDAPAAAFAANTESLRLYSEALARLRMGDAPTALPLLDRAVSLDARSPFPEDALAGAYTRLGFDARAKEAAQRALELSAGLPREIRLGIEARSREVRGEWAPAVEIYSNLWRLHPDDLEVGLRLAAAQKSAGHADVSLATVATLRKLPPPAGGDPRIDLAEADATWQLGDFARCREATTRAIAGAERRGATLLAAQGHLIRGWSLHRLGEEDAALAELQRAHGLYLKMGDRAGAAGALVAVAGVFQATGRPAESRRAFEEAIPTLREIGDRSREAKALNNFAALLGDQGDIPGVTALLERSLAIKRETGDLAGAATALANLGNLLRGRGDIREAHARLEEALKLQRGLKNEFGTAFALRGLARVLVKEDRAAEALTSLEEALGLSRKTGDAEGAAEALLGLGDLTRQTGRPEKARDWYRQAFEAFQRLRQTSSMVYPLVSLAEMDEEQNRFGSARTHYERALTLTHEADNPFLEAHVRSGLASTVEKQGDVTRARGEHEKALALWTRLGDKDQVAKTRKALAKLGGA